MTSTKIIAHSISSSFKKLWKSIVSSLTDKEKYKNLAKSLKYSLYVITHPMDGFWDLTHEKRGSLAAANTLIFLLVLMKIFTYMFTNFMYLTVQWNKINVIMELATLLAPIFLGVVANWCLTCLFDGKGKMRDIYMGVAYGLTPYILVQIPLIIFSNFSTIEEGVFYGYIMTFSLIWSGFLILCSQMQIHDFTLLKTVIMVLATAFGMLVIIFILMMFFSLFADTFAYFKSIYKEIALRLY